MTTKKTSVRLPSSLGAYVQTYADREGINFSKALTLVVSAYAIQNPLSAQTSKAA
jgi:hypothetical protein